MKASRAARNNETRRTGLTILAALILSASCGVWDDPIGSELAALVSPTPRIDVAGMDPLPRSVSIAEEDFRVRVSRLLHLGTSGDAAARPSIEKALQTDLHPTVRLAAAAALGELGSVEAVRALARAAERDEVAEVRAAARHAGQRLSASPPPRTFLALGLLTAEDQAATAAIVAATRSLAPGQTNEAGGGGGQPRVVLDGAVRKSECNPLGASVVCSTTIEYTVRTRGLVRATLVGTATVAGDTVAAVREAAIHAAAGSALSGAESFLESLGRE